MSQTSINDEKQNIWSREGLDCRSVIQSIIAEASDLLPNFICTRRSVDRRIRADLVRDNIPEIALLSI